MSDPIVDQAGFNRAVASALRDLYVLTTPGETTDTDRQLDHDADYAFRATLARLDDYAFRDTSQ